jgi:hypothetical protein
MLESFKIRIWILPFDSFDLEAFDRLAQGGELVEPFAICESVLEIFPLNELN